MAETYWHRRLGGLANLLRLDFEKGDPILHATGPNLDRVASPLWDQNRVIILGGGL